MNRSQWFTKKDCEDHSRSHEEKLERTYKCIKNYWKDNNNIVSQAKDWKDHNRAKKINRKDHIRVQEKDWKDF